MPDTSDPITLRQQFLAAIAPLSAREAATQTGIAFSTIARLRRWEDWGITARVQRKMSAYLRGEPELEPGDTRQTTVQRIKALEERVGALEKYIAAQRREWATVTEWYEQSGISRRHK